ncbi:universal stress protein [Bradyrhizobium sp.]|uniref:universal stress protein n=1 Tax=Bradyrhizobium sp. TaxID=376 RepID=UPI003C76B5AB
MYNHVLIPTDGSPLSTVAVEHSMDFARDADAKVTVLTVVSPFHVFSADASRLADTRADYEQRARMHAAEILTDAQRKAQARGVRCDVLQLESDSPYDAIIKTANKSGCDLIAMASHGRRGVAAVVLGSETLKVLTHSKIPVLVYR